jgi:hypothetical protein
MMRGLDPQCCRPLRYRDCVPFSSFLGATRSRRRPVRACRSPTHEPRKTCPRLLDLAVPPLRLRTLGGCASARVASAGPRAVAYRDSRSYEPRPLSAGKAKAFTGAGGGCARTSWTSLPGHAHSSGNPALPRRAPTERSRPAAAPAGARVRDRTPVRLPRTVRTLDRASGARGVGVGGAAYLRSPGALSRFVADLLPAPRSRTLVKRFSGIP